MVHCVFFSIMSKNVSLMDRISIILYVEISLKIKLCLQQWLI